MKSIVLSLAVGLCLAIPAGAEDAKTPPPAAVAAAAAASAHVMVRPMELKWGDAPAALPKGAKFAVLSGDPGAVGPYTIRLKFPAGYKIPPHWHPTDENLTVVAGTFWLGMGDTFDEKTMKSLPAAGYAVLPAEMRHYAWAKTGATVQIHGMGPFAITYVNPSDDPRGAPAK
ncbi:MAG TPA: cupin domain-containing protein [Candidatus Limnocylindrales bacterium]|nr:cupin domain-containing protein [Candidatus Limnocylindrales bacterium]